MKENRNLFVLLLTATVIPKRVDVTVHEGEFFKIKRTKANCMGGCEQRDGGFFKALCYQQG